MTENNEILDKLIGSQKNENLISDFDSTTTNNVTSITTSRVVGVRYKFYAIILLLLIFVI